MLEDWAVGPNTTGSDHVTGPPKHIKQLAMSRELKPTIRIGKLGLTESLISEIIDQLNTKNLVKIKMNRGLFDKNDVGAVWNHIAESTNSMLISARGNVGVLWKH